MFTKPSFGLTENAFFPVYRIFINSSWVFIDLHESWIDFLWFSKIFPIFMYISLNFMNSHGFSWIRIFFLLIFSKNSKDFHKSFQKIWIFIDLFNFFFTFFIDFSEKFKRFLMIFHKFWKKDNQFFIKFIRFSLIFFQKN